jgi:arginyl-tRNA synthetase
MISKVIRESIEKALQNLDISGVSFVVEHPTDLAHGDYATNVAMAASKALGKNSREVAEIIVSEINNQNVPEIESIEIAGPGFINFKLVPEFFMESMKEIITAEHSFGNLEINEGKNVLIEHSSPNLFKPFHIGHMMNNAIGESLVRLMRASGANVTTMSFPSDISLGVAKAIFMILEKAPDQFQNQSIEVLGNAYVEGVKRYDEDESIHARVKEIADNLYAKKDSAEVESL